MMQFRLELKYLLLLVAVIAGCASRPRSGLGEYTGRDLREAAITDVDRFRLALAQTVGDQSLITKEWEGLAPWWVRSFESGEAMWVAVEVQQLITIPGWAGFRVHSFDKDWRPLAKGAFWTGYRQELADVQVTPDPELEQDLLLVTIESRSRG
jgi:hypothetical protein